MRKQYQNILKSFFCSKVFYTRDTMGITQEDMAHTLAMAPRTFIDLEHGKSGCSALTFALFLIYICQNPTLFLEELRNAFETDQKKTA